MWSGHAMGSGHAIGSGHAMGSGHRPGVWTPSWGLDTFLVWGLDTASRIDRSRGGSR